MSDLTAASLAAALRAAADVLEGAAPAAKPASTKKEKPAAPKEEKKTEPASKHTHDDVRAALLKVKNDVSRESAITIIKDAGFTSMSEITPDAFDKVMAACDAAMSGGGDDDL